MANKFNRVISNIKNITKQAKFTNEDGNILTTKDDRAYVRVNDTYKPITFPISGADAPGSINGVDVDVSDDASHSTMIMKSNNHIIMNKVSDVGSQQHINGGNAYVESFAVDNVARIKVSDWSNSNKHTELYVRPDQSGLSIFNGVDNRFNLLLSDNKIAQVSSSDSVTRAFKSWLDIREPVTHKFTEKNITGKADNQPGLNIDVYENDFEIRLVFSGKLAKVGGATDLSYIAHSKDLGITGDLTKLNGTKHASIYFSPNPSSNITLPMQFVSDGIKMHLGNIDENGLQFLQPFEWILYK